MAPGDFVGNFGADRSWIFASLAIVVVFFLVQVVFSAVGDRKGLGEERVDQPYVVGIFVFMSLIGMVLMLVTGGFDFQDRLQARAGSGFIFIFGYAGFALCLSIAAGVIARMPLWKAIFLCAPTVVFFAAAGHRSTSLVALICPLLPYVQRVVMRNRMVLPAIFCVAVLSANYVNYLTGSVRSLLEQRRDISVESVMERYESLRNERPIPLATSHLEMLGSYIGQ